MSGSLPHATAILALAQWSIPWDLLSTNDRNAIAWACAALFASVPAAVASLLWVQAWRGSPRFGSPRCEACHVELLAADRTLPERCPECGRPTVERRRSRGAAGVGSGLGDHVCVHFGFRRWSVRSAVGTFALGTLAFGAAIASAWFGGMLVSTVARESTATAQVDAIRATLTGHRSHRAIIDSLRFAADSAPADEDVRRASLAALDAFEADDIPADRGLALLLDRFDDASVRTLLIDLIGSLAAASTIDADRAMRLLARVRGTPSVLLPAALIHAQPRTGLDFTIDLLTDDPNLRASLLAVRSAEGRDLMKGSMRGIARGRVSAGCTATASDDLSRLTVTWRLEWLAPAEFGGGPGEPSGEVPPAARLSVERSETVDLAHASVPATPFLAQRLRPRITVEAVGAISLISMQVRGMAMPGWRFPGRWELAVGDARLPVRAELSGDGQLQLRTIQLASIAPDAMPETMELVYTPLAEPEASADATGATMGRAWPSTFRMTNLPWSRPR